VEQGLSPELHETSAWIHDPFETIWEDGFEVRCEESKRAFYIALIKWGLAVGKITEEELR